VLILLWLLPPVLVTCVAAAWVGWLGRDRPTLSERSEAAQERARQRFAEALQRDLPQPGGGPVQRPRERSTGVAVRRPAGARDQRRSA
jgi:hypothetical protein